MKIHTLAKAAAIAAISVAATGCTAWDSMSSRQKGAVTGAGVGGVAGAVLTDGSVLGTVGGAAIGGVVGDQVGKNR